MLNFIAIDFRLYKIFKIMRVSFLALDYSTFRPFAGNVRCFRFTSSSNSVITAAATVTRKYFCFRYNRPVPYEVYTHKYTIIFTHTHIQIANGRRSLKREQLAFPCSSYCYNC